MASLLGRILHAFLLIFVVTAVTAANPALAAPFAAIVMDGRTGEILYEKNAHTRLHPASLTKMMTLYIAFQEIEAGRLSLDTKVKVTKYAASQPPSRLGLKPGQKIALRYLIRAAAVKSANDAASAIGDHIGGDAATFAKRMTRTARQLGMDDTTFKNANGLTAEGHQSSAYDMNILGRHLFYDFPQYYNIFSRRTADAGIATVANTNTRFLDNYEGADGIKTGYTSPAGFNLTASARRGNKHIIATVFGGTSTANRNATMADLMDLGFGEAKNRVKEKPPVAPAPEDALIASAAPSGIDEIDAEGGAGKTVRVSGSVLSSPRPKARPDASSPVVPEPVAVAMAEGIAGALAEVTAAPAPAGTLDFQAEAIATTESPAPDAAKADAGIALAAAEPAADAVLAADTPATPEPGSLDAQAAALAAGTPPADTALATALPEPTRPAADGNDPALARLAEAKPRARPEAPDPASLPVEATAVAAAELPPLAPELVITDPGTAPEAPLQLAAADLPANQAPSGDTLAKVTEVETVAAAALAVPVTAIAPALVRKAPIFDAVDLAKAPAEDPGEKVVVVMSTSGGRHFGVNVGEFASRYDAERALLKTALAESATLNDGLRKTSQSDGAWRASFLGLTEEQAELACRRLRARAVPCETVGG